MKFDLACINIGELIRFKDHLLKTDLISKLDFDVITDFLARFIGEDD